MNRAELLAAMEASSAVKPRLVKVPGLGDVYIRALTIADVDEERADIDKKDKASAARGACRVLSDENGNRLLDPSNPDDVAAMSKQPMRVLIALNKAAEEAEKEAEPGN